MDIAELGLSIRSDGIVVATNRLDKMTGASKRASTSMGRLIKRTKAFSKAAKQIGRNMTVLLTLPILALGVAAVRAFAAFDDAMISSQAIMGDLTDMMKNDMSAAAREMGRTTIFSAEQAAESYFFLASAGLDAAASIAALPKVAAFAQAGVFDMAKATDILTDAQSALGRVMKDPIENMEEMVKLSDVLVKANTIANASVQQFGEALTNKAGTAMKQLNIDVESGVAVLAAWADQGIKSTEAGEKFNIVTRDLQSAIRKNADEFKRFKIEVFDDGTFRNLGDIIGDLEGALGSMTVEQQGATLALLGFQDRSVIAIRSLLGLSEKIKGYEESLRSAGGITQEVAEKQLGSFSKQLLLMKGELNDIAIELGQALVPAMDSVRTSADGFLEALRGVVETFASYDVATQKSILKHIAFVAVLGPVLIVLGAIAGAVTALTPLFALMITPIGFVVVGLIALAIKILLIKNRFDELREESRRLAGSLDEVTEALKISSTVADSVLQLEKLRARWSENTQAIKDTKGVLQQFADVGIHTGERVEALDRTVYELTQDTLGVMSAMETARDNIIGFEKATADAAEDADALAKGLEEAAEAAVIAATALALTKEQLKSLTTWWETLLGQIDPVAQATADYEKQVALLDMAIAAGAVDIENRGAAILQLQENMRDASGETALAEWWQELSASIDPAAAAMADFDKQVIQLDKSIKAGTTPAKARAKAMAELHKQMEESIGVTGDLANRLKRMQSAADPATAAALRFKDALMEMNDLRVAMESDGHFMGDEFWGEMENGLDRAINGTATLGESLERAGSLAANALRGIQSSMTDGSKAYEQMNIAIQAANVVTAIGAVINQARGDPYTAFARMASMAAAVAALGVSIGGFGGGFTDTAAQRQEEQGTGSVLGDATAKSESILNAVEITASASEQLVGLNRGMLNALNALQAGIGSASGSVASGVSEGAFSGLPSVLNFDDIFGGGGSVGNLFGLNFVGSLLSSIFGGKAKITDEGIALLSGSIAELINGDLVKAYQEVKSKKWLFGKKRTREELIDLSGNAAGQIGLIFQSMADAVREGALALGISSSEIQAALDAFQIEETRISLKDLTAEEQEAELQAVFSKIFDGMALAVVPFIGQFQKVGEGLGETLIRVATSVQVMREAVTQLGFSLDETDPEKFAQIAVGLVEMAGGIDAFISKMQNFVSKFATDEHKLAVATSALLRGLDAVGLVLPETAEGFWDLMQSLDASTEEGQRQIAMLLELANAADTYYQLELEAAALREDNLNAEVDALLYIQAIARGIIDSLTALRDMIISDQSTPEENYERERAEAAKLTDALRTMTDPDLIAETVARIEQLTRSAYGMLDEGQREAMAGEFLTFLDEVQALALERLNVSADEQLASTEFTAEEILARFNDEVTDPLILVAGLQEQAALRLLEAAELLMAKMPANFTIPPPPETTPDNSGSKSAQTPDVEPADPALIAEAITMGLVGASQQTVLAIQRALAEVQININIPQGSIINE